MKISVSSDEYTDLVKAVCRYMEENGHDVVYYGPSAGEAGDAETDWPCVTEKAVTDVVEYRSDEAVVMCWTGTGATIAANKIKGIRAALCHDAETAKGARIWNHANALALSLRATSVPMAEEILQAWFSTPYSSDEWNLQQMARIRAMEGEE